jgi:lambda family phage portal protein
MRFADRILSAVGLQRSPKRRSGFSSAWQGAESSRLNASWMTPAASINADLRWQLPTLRARSRWLCENNGYCVGFASAVENNVIGPRGIQLRGEVRNAAGDFVTKTNDALEFGFTDWGNMETCDVARRLTWLDAEKLAARTTAIDGECFIRLWRGFDNAYGFAVQFIDTDLVDETYNIRSSAGQNEIRMGIELDVFGAAIAYYLLTRHPADGGTRDRIRVPASDIVHLFIPLRAGQVRGVPWLAPVITDVQMLDGYEEAELVAARVAATQMGLLVPGEDADVDPKAPADRRFSAEPGQFRELPKGFTLTNWDPQHPNTAFGAFIESILRCVARGTGVMSYMTLTGDLTNANYSSLRAGQAPERDAWRALHQWLIPRLHRRVYRAWLPYALLSGKVAVDSRLASNYQTVTWKGRGWVSVDPLKDIQAWERKIRLGTGSRTKMLSEEGEDYEATIDELADEARYAQQENVDISGVDASQPTLPGATDPLIQPSVTGTIARETRRPALRGLRSLSARGIK